VKFPQDTVCQKLLKFIKFLPSYSKYKKGDVFLRHYVYIYITEEADAA